MSDAHAPPSYVRTIAKLGYVGKGAMYLGVALLAVMTALGYASDPEGMRGVFHTLARQPFGRFAIAALGLGMAAYSFWRWFEALVNPAGESGAKGAGKRLAFAVSAAIHSALAWTAFRIAFSGRSNETDSATSQTDKETWTAIALGWPLGEWLVGGVGAVIVLVGVRQLVRAYQARFVDRMHTERLGEGAVQTLRTTGRIGLTARGLAFVLMGGFVIIAAVRHNPEQTRGLDGTLDVLAQQRYGQTLLVAVGIGLACYAAYCWASAALRTFTGTDKARVDFTI
jgi:hypothetical protein